MDTQNRDKHTSDKLRRDTQPPESYLQYINAFCAWARHPGERTRRHVVFKHHTKPTHQETHENRHGHFWSSFIRQRGDMRCSSQTVEFEAISPFESNFPRILEIRTRFYSKHSSLLIKELYRDSKRAPALPLDQFCLLNRDRGSPERLSLRKLPSQEPLNVPSYLDPFDDNFGHSKRSKLTLNLDTVYESADQWDEKLFSKQSITASAVGSPIRHRRRLSHKERRARLIRKKMREYSRETIVKKRQMRKAFRTIPLGLRFPSPGHKVVFISVSPFDESFPNGALSKILNKKKTMRHIVIETKTDSVTPKLSLPRPDAAPFPALTPIAAQSFAKRGFFGDQSPRMMDELAVVQTTALANYRVYTNTSGLY